MCNSASFERNSGLNPQIRETQKRLAVGAPISAKIFSGQNRFKMVFLLSPSFDCSSSCLPVLLVTAAEVLLNQHLPGLTVRK
jgi:hypothetical protein